MISLFPLYNSKAIHTVSHSHAYLSHVSLTGEWEARFDPQFTSKEVFYLDNKNFVHVDMMNSAKYPLSLLEDGELGAQVGWLCVCTLHGTDNDISPPFPTSAGVSVSFIFQWFPFLRLFYHPTVGYRLEPVHFPSCNYT